jgi:hypothetical protein
MLTVNQLRCTISVLFLFFPFSAYPWGFFAHERINRLAVFGLPPEMMLLYKANLDYITKHATDPDKRRYMVPAEGPRHYIDIDLLDSPPYRQVPRSWNEAVTRYSADSLNRYGILPWHLEKMLALLTKAFREKDKQRILRLSAELGHYLADAHVPLHACSNHNGQFSNQHGIHGLWESRIPELLADETFDYWTGKAYYIASPREYIWQIITLSGKEADSVLRIEKELSNKFPAGRRFAYESRNGALVRTYADDYTKTYAKLLNNMVERKMRSAISAVAAAWYTCWVNAGQPPLSDLADNSPAPADSLDRLAPLQLRWMEEHCK